MSATYAPCFANGFHTTTKGAHTLAWGREFRIGERRLLGENIATAWKLQSELLQRRFWVDSIMNTGSNELRNRSDLILAEDTRTSFCAPLLQAIQRRFRPRSAFHRGKDSLEMPPPCHWHRRLRPIAGDERGEARGRAPQD